MRLVMPLRKWD